MFGKAGHPATATALSPLDKRLSEADNGAEAEVNTRSIAAVTCLLALVGAAAANPIMVVMYSEVRVAPDSLEAIELYPYENIQGHIDLSDCSILMNAGVAVIDSGVVLEESSFVVLDRSNTSGVFSLGDSCDSIVIKDPYGWPLEGGIMMYPSYYTDGPAFVPQPGQSAALFQRYVNRWPDPYYWYRWFTDSTPTFGSRNDDTLGRISGRVYDDRGLPVSAATVAMRNPRGADYIYTDSAGRYSIFPVGPGTYELSARKNAHLPGVFPDSVRLGVNQQVDTIDIWLYRVGVEERTTPGASRGTPEATVVRRALWLGTRSELPGNSVMSRAVLVDASGRRLLDLRPGPNDVSALAPGVYFVRGPGVSRRLVLAR
jgi:hypothetical protein